MKTLILTAVAVAITARFIAPAIDSQVNEAAELQKQEMTQLVQHQTTKHYAW